MTRDPVEFSTSLERVDRDWLWGELATKVYWGKNRDRAMFDRQLDLAWRRRSGASPRHDRGRSAP